MCKRCRSFFLLGNSKDFDTRRKEEEEFKKQEEENFSSGVFPWSSSFGEDDDDSDDDSDAMMLKRKVLVVLGGGIAGAKCAEELLRLTLDSSSYRYEIVLIEKSKVLKVFDEETGMMTRTTVFSSQQEQRRRLHVLRGEAIKIDGEKQTVTVRRVVDNEDDEDDIDGENSTKVKVREIHFDQICFAVGARPKRLLETISTDDDDENDDTIVKYVRDTESAKVLSDALREAFKRSKNGSGSRCGEEEEKKEKSTNTTRIVVSGNGAVALEIINALDESFLQMVMSFVKAELERAVGGKNHHYHRRRRMMIGALKRMQVVWVVKHESIGDALFDRDASAFLLEHRRARRETARRKILGEIEEARVKRVNKNDNGDNQSQRGEKEETTTSIKKENDATTEKKFTFDEKISYPRRRGAFGATLRAKTSSAGPDWFKRINASLHFDDIFDDEKDAIEVKMKRKEGEVVEIDNEDDDDDDRDNVEEKENNQNEDLDACLTSVVNVLFETDWLSIETNCEIKDIVPFVENGCKNATVHLTNNTSVSDVVVVAACVGVEPNGCDLFGDEATAKETFGFVKSDGNNNMFITDGIRVTETFELELSNKPNVFFAAGDCALCERRNEDKSTNWFQMRSWSQAAQSGAQCARSMLRVDGYEYGLGFNFELFTHSTTFFGLKVVLLGSFNLQKFLPEADEKDVRILSRKFIDDDDASGTSNDAAGKNKEDVFSSSLCSNSSFIRVVTYKGKVVGAVLVGETNLEETFENLIQDKIDVSHLESDLLDPDVDIEDYFD
ncbi:unnamed protein product [Bathycoccus prasinos]